MTTERGEQSEVAEKKNRGIEKGKEERTYVKSIRQNDNTRKWAQTIVLFNKNMFILDQVKSICMLWGLEFKSLVKVSRYHFLFCINGKGKESL